jgi:hypothetical protein
MKPASHDAAKVKVTEVPKKRQGSAQNYLKLRIATSMKQKVVLNYHNSTGLRPFLGPASTNFSDRDPTEK